MKNTIKNTSLQQARKNADIPLTTMAKLLFTDVSNLSKYERGIKHPNSEIVLGYHLLTGVSLESLYRHRIVVSTEVLQFQIQSYLQKLKRDIRSIKVDTLISRLQTCLDNMSCLSEIKSEKKHDV